MTVGRANHDIKSGALRAIGDPFDMLIYGKYLENVGYLMIDDPELGLGPEATVFFVSYPVSDKSFGPFEYVVTCRHVIEGIKKRPAFIRINDKRGAAVDYPTAETDWVCADGTDVAVCPLRMDRSARYWAYPLPLPPFDLTPTHLENSLRPGHAIFFVGLFHPIPGQDSVEAIVRSGMMARPSVVTEIYINDAEQTKIQCHVIEAVSWGGESGSPVFVYENVDDAFGMRFIDPKTGERGPVHSTQMRPTLLGMLHGHFQIPHDVKVNGRTVGGVEINTGIAVVIPIRHIQDTLMDKRVVADRQRTAGQRKKAREVLPKPDSRNIAEQKDQSFSQADFEDALKKVARKIEPKQKRRP